MHVMEMVAKNLLLPSNATYFITLIVSGPASFEHKTAICQTHFRTILRDMKN